MKTITVEGRTYTIRGQMTAKQIRSSYATFQQSLPNSKLSLMGFLRHNGLIHAETQASIRRNRNNSRLNRKGIKDMIGTPNNSVETTAVVANSHISGSKVEIPALEIKVKNDDDSSHTVSVVLTRLAAIRLYHQLNILLFSR